MNPKDAKTAARSQDPIIIRGTKEKKRILSDYQDKFGSNYPDSIITQKKVSHLATGTCRKIVREECDPVLINGIG